MNFVLELPAAHGEALIKILETVPPDEIPWVLTGSGGLRLQGVGVPINDLDIQSDRAGIELIAERFSDLLRVPPKLKVSPLLRSYMGEMELGGIKVELIGDMQHRAKNGSWREPVNLLNHRHWVSWEGRQVPVLDLHYEAEAYTRMGRPTKAAAILTVLASRELKDPE